LINMTDANRGINWIELCWPGSKLDEALEQIASQSGLSAMLDISAEIISPAPLESLSQAASPSISSLALEAWIMTTADQLGMLAEAVQTPYADAESMILKASPALFRLTCPFPDQEPHYLLTLKTRRNKITVLRPDLSTQRIATADVRGAWCYTLEADSLAQLQRVWDELGLSQKARKGAETAVMRTDLASKAVEGCWLFHPPPHVSIWKQMRRNKIVWLLALMLIINLLQQGVTLGGWAIIGRGSFEGRFDSAWVMAWVLVMFTGVLLQALIYNIQGPLATSTLRFLKSRLLYGALKLEPDEIRHQGSGQFFGRVLESDMVQNYLIGGALIALPFGIMLVTAGTVLWFGAGGWIHTVLLGVWTIVAFYIGWRRLVHGTEGLRIYREMTNDLVENMIGHRTRLAQENRGRWHEDEDKSLALYTDMSRHFDLNGVQLDVLIPRGWLVLGLLGIAYPFVTMSASIEKLAISIGGIMLASMAFESLAQAMKFLAQSMISWRQIAPLLQAANRTEPVTASANLLPEENSKHHAQSDDHRQPVMMLRDVTFRYHDRGQAILKNCHLTISQGDQILLEGTSGGGKSTLAAILSGLRQPESGLLLLWGFDAHTVGNTLWRNRVATAPQFQENHIFSDTLAFNLLMGRGWPSSEGDLEDADQICRELGLGGLLDRMPDGLDQLVGDGGWQLSFGERSRLYIARALLQNSDLVILDESFGALDPESLQQAMECVLKWTTTLLVIAHP
jgi:ATP-binding cassette subfamily B protein